jgi:hypothetical protein
MYPYYPYYWSYGYYPRAAIGQFLPSRIQLPSDVLKKDVPLPSPSPSPTPSPGSPPSPQGSPLQAAGIAVVKSPLGLDVYVEPRRNSLLAVPHISNNTGPVVPFSGPTHLFNNDSVQVLETDIVEWNLSEDSRPRWWRIQKEVTNQVAPAQWSGPPVYLTGYVRALDESGGYKLEPLTVLPGRNITQNLQAVYRRRF